jgi:hypothetical protein
MATKNIDSGKVNLYRLMYKYTFWSVGFSETPYNWTNHFVETNALTTLLAGV